jgi:hypothetical protein
MPTGSNLDLKMDPLPIPDEAPVQQAQEQGKQDLARKNQLPPGAGFASKGSQYAHFADSILTGWMAGRHTKQVKELEKAKGDVTSSRSIYESLADTYRRNIAAGKEKDDPEMKKAAENISAAWNNYVNTAEKYTAPEEGKDGKKKGGMKEKAAKMFGFDIHPEMFREGSIKMLRQSGAPVLSESMSMQDQAAKFGMDEAKKQAQARDAEQKTKDDWKKLVAIDPKQRTPEQEKQLQALERQMLGPETKEQQVKEQFYADMQQAAKDAKPLDDSKRKLYQDMGLMSKDNPSINMVTDSRGHVQMIATSPDGKTVVASEVKDKNGKPLQERLPPDQAEIAERLHKWQFNQLTREYETANSDVTDKQELHRQATKFALSAMTGYKLLGGTPADAEKNQFTLSRAIKATISELPKKDQEVFQNFAVVPANDVDGVYAYRSNFANPKDPAVQRWWWFNKPEKYYGGIGKDELAARETEFRTRLLTTLRKQNPKMTDEQVRALMPPPIYRDMPQSQPSMAPLPQQSGAQGPPQMTAPPGAVKSYAAYAEGPNGQQLGFNTQTKQWEPVEQE